VFNTSYSQNEIDTLLASDNAVIPLPTVSVNFGFNHLMSDVRLEPNGPSPYQQFGYQLSITQRAAKFLNVTLDLYTGTVYGEEQRNLTNLNFRTTMFSQRLNVEYNFFPLLKPDSEGRQLIRPYVGFGVGVLFFRSKGDLEDESGNAYQYWSDKLIYAEDIGTVAQSEATLLTRDFEYETDLRDANLDGLRKYSQTAFTLPLNAGIRFQITKNIGVNAAFAYAFNFTDMLDNVGSNGSGDRIGSSGNDNHLYGSIGLSVFLGVTKPSSRPKSTFVDELASVETESTEKDSADTKRKNTTNLNDLVAISNKLIQASESLVKIANETEIYISKENSSLAEITERNLATKKEFRNAKKESITLLDKSIAALRETNSGLQEASNNLNTAYSDFTTKKVDTLATSKVKNIVETKIPAIESLKSQIESVRTATELKSVLEITSKNLNHTNEIFKDESSRMSKSILSSRKTVIEARVQQLKSDFQIASENEEPDLWSVIDTPTTIPEELVKLLQVGILSKAEYHQLTKSTNSVEKSAEFATHFDPTKHEKADAHELAATTELLKSASKTVVEKTTKAEQFLANINRLLSELTKQELNSRSALDKAKIQALDLVEQSRNNLIRTNKEMNSLASNLNAVSLKLNHNDDSKIQLEGANKLKSTIGAIIFRLNETKSKMQGAKTSENLNQIITLTNKNIDATTDVLSQERNWLAHSTLKNRKEVARNLLATLALTPTDSEELSSLEQEIESLKQEGMLSEIEVSEVEELISVIKQSNATTKNASSSSENYEVTEQIDQSNELAPSSNPKLATEDEALTAEVKAVDKPRTVEEIENTPPKLSGGFHWSDVNKNGWISPDEVLHFIDLLFEGESLRNVEDIQSLIDYYFDQE
jgi:hypothetical protein